MAWVYNAMDKSVKIALEDKELLFDDRMKSWPFINSRLSLSKAQEAFAREFFTFPLFIPRYFASFPEIWDAFDT